MSKTLDQKLSLPGDSYFMDLSRGEALKIQDEVRIDEAVLRGQIHTLKQVYAVDSKEIERLTNLTQEKDARIAELTAELALFTALADKANRERCDLTCELAKQSADADSMAKWIASRGQARPDHACAECIGTGDLVVPGWSCGYHVAIARNAPMDVIA